MHPLKSAIERLAATETASRTSEARQTFLEFREQLTKGKIRAAEKIDGEWRVNVWVKQGILLGFRIGELSETGTDSGLSFVDKDTFPARRFTIKHRVRLVPGGSSVREGAYVAPSVICMPPMFINVGAYVDEGTIVRARAVLGAGTILTRSTPLYDIVRGEVYRAAVGKPLEVPENAVVVPGSRAVKKGHAAEWGLSLYAPVIVKYRDEKTDRRIELEEWLR